MVELHYKFKMLPETLYVAVMIIDRYLVIEDNINKPDL